MEAKHENHTPVIRLAILQRVCPEYRVALFSQLSSEPSLHTQLFIGQDIPRSKVKSTTNLNGIRVKKLKTFFLKIGRRVFPVHRGLIGQLRQFNPDVILCEGESHFIGYLQAILYRTLFNRRVALIHWCFISLPGEPVEKTGIAEIIKRKTRTFFDAFLLYSSFSKKSLVALGESAEKAFVATNVGDVGRFLRISDTIRDSKETAREKLHLKERFTVLYTGTLDRNKKPDLVLDLARKCDAEKFNFVLLGAGEMLDELRQTVTRENLNNVFLPGRVTEELYLYYRASNVLIIPGRGGIIISEAMAFGLPVIVFQADGTEYDLVANGETGYILHNGDVNDFRSAIENLERSPSLYHTMEVNSRSRVESKFTTDNMVKQIIQATLFAKKSRTKALEK